MTPQTHLAKCARNHPNSDVTICSFNATHRLPRAQMAEHLRTCPDRRTVELWVSSSQLEPPTSPSTAVGAGGVRGGVVGGRGSDSKVVGVGRGVAREVGGTARAWGRGRAAPVVWRGGGVARSGGRGVVLTVRGEAVAGSCSGGRGQLDQERGQARPSPGEGGGGQQAEEVTHELVLEENTMAKEVKSVDVKAVIKEAEVKVKDRTKEEAMRLVCRGRGKQVRAKFKV